MDGDHEGWFPVKSHVLTQYSMTFRYGFLEIPLTTTTMESCTRESSTDEQMVSGCCKVQKA